MKSETPLAEITSAARLNLSGSWGASIGVFVLLHFFLGGTSLSFVSWFFTGALTVGMCSFFMGVSSGIPRITMLFDGFECFGKSLVAMLLTSLFVMLWSLLFIIPGIIKTYSYAMTFFVLADDPSVGALGAITRSREIMNGNKWRLFCLYFRFIGWGILCVLTFGIGFLWLWPYMMASTATFYEDIKDAT